MSKALIRQNVYLRVKFNFSSFTIMECFCLFTRWETKLALLLLHTLKSLAAKLLKAVCHWQGIESSVDVRKRFVVCSLAFRNVKLPVLFWLACRFFTSSSSRGARNERWDHLFNQGTQKHTHVSMRLVYLNRESNKNRVVCLLTMTLHMLRLFVQKLFLYTWRRSICKLLIQCHWDTEKII